jgi:hypothetical protein
VIPHFDFKSTNATGSAPRGRIESSAGSLVNRAQIWVDQDWSGSVASGDEISISILAPTAFQEVFMVTPFVGIISQVRPAGDLILIECVTASARLLLATAQVRAWANTMVAQVLSDLLAMSAFDASLASFPDAFQSKLLHCWNTDGGLVAHEITELLAAVAPDVHACAMPDGALVFGSRGDLAAQLSTWVFPTDASINAEGVPEYTRTRFSLRPVYAHQAVASPIDGSLLGTVDSVKHYIAPGQVYTDVVLDRTPDAGVSV